MSVEINLSMASPLVRAYVFYSAVLAMKLMLMSILTARQRITKGIFANPEDAKIRGKVKLDDVQVERVRRAHLNDIENIPMFMVLSFLYILTGPSAYTFTMLLRVFTIARILHTFVYLAVIPQPARAIAFGVGYIISWFMGIQVFLSFVSAM